MTASIWKVGTSNAFSTTLNGGITDTDATIALTSVTGLQAPGVLVIDRVDANNTSTPTTREYISFTGIAGSSITGCSRNLGGSLAQAHSSGARVEETWSVTHWNDFIDMYNVSHNSAGAIVTSAASIATLQNTRISNVSLTSQDVTITNSLNISGVSLTGNFPITPVWVISGAMSLATTSAGKPLLMPQNGLFDYFSATVRTPVSGASLLIDVNKNGTTIFSDQNTRLYISPGGTYVSTASIGVKSFLSGDVFTVDLDSGAGSSQDLTVISRAR